jgi:hypothetical protein
VGFPASIRLGPRWLGRCGSVRVQRNVCCGSSIYHDATATSSKCALRWSTAQASFLYTMQQSRHRGLV